MNLLEFFFIISGVIILIIAFDIAKKQKFNALHFLVFIGVGGGLLVFTLFPQVLTSIGNIFGLARGADVLVYTSIIFLLYFVLLLLAKVVENKEDMTKLVREQAIEKSEKKEISGEEIILLRAYNEAPVLAGCLNQILDLGYKNILLVNDGSIDETKDILKNYEHKIIIINHCFNRGAGAALETGFEYIRRFGKVDYIISLDTDLQHKPEDIEQFLDILKRNKDIDIVLGSRFIEKTDSNVPFSRKITLFLGRIFTFLISGIYLTDTHNGFRGFQKKTIDKMRLTIDGMAYASEVLDLIKKQNMVYEEIPVTIHYTDYSLSKGQKSGNAIAIALRIIWSKFFK